MTTSDMIRELCDRMNISLAELCRRIGQTPQNFNKKSAAWYRILRGNGEDCRGVGCWI